AAEQGKCDFSDFPGDRGGQGPDRLVRPGSGSSWIAETRKERTPAEHAGWGPRPPTSDSATISERPTGSQLPASSPRAGHGATETPFSALPEVIRDRVEQAGGISDQALPVKARRQKETGVLPAVGAEQRIRRGLLLRRKRLGRRT